MRISDWSSDVCSSDLCLAPLGVEEQCPAAAEPLERIVRPRTGADQLGLGRGFEIGTAEGEHPQAAAVLVEHHAGRDQRCPGQMIGEAFGAIAIFAQAQHAKYPFWRLWRRRTGAKMGSRRAATTATL